jgi:hypothetical protein
MFNFGKIAFDSGHYANANAGPGSYREGNVMLKLGLMLQDRYGTLTTRTDGNDLVLLKRAKLAKAAGCNTLISLHTNAPIEADGIIIFYSMHRPEDKAMAEYIGRELSKATGIPFRAAKTRPSKSYPNQDYYGMIRHPVSFGIEHAFIVEHGSHWEMAIDTDTKLQNIVKCYGRILGLIKEEPAVYKQILLGTDKIPPTVQFGDRGDNVKLLQRELNKAGFNCGVADGDFGGKTLLAVIDFQRNCGMVKDGIVGKMTWTALLTVHVVELSHKMIKAGLVSNAGREIAKVVKNFINANFFSGRNTIGWLISEGKVLHDRHEIGVPWVKPKGTLIVYKDGRVEAGLKYDSEIVAALDDIWFCCQGFNLFPLNIKKEGFDPAEVGRTCTSVMIGHTQGKVIIAVRQGTNASRAVDTMEALKCGGAIRLDSGLSANLWVDGKAIFTSDRALTNIILW